MQRLLTTIQFGSGLVFGSDMEMYAPHFSKEELLFSQAATRKRIDNSIPIKLEPNLIRLSWWLEKLREEIGRPIYITSGYRCPLLNSYIGGSKTSAHVKGFAADIVVRGIDSYEVALIAAEVMKVKEYDQIINEFGRWVHVGLAPIGEARFELLTATDQHGGTLYEKGILDT